MIEMSDQSRTRLQVQDEKSDEIKTPATHAAETATLTPELCLTLMETTRENTQVCH